MADHEGAVRVLAARILTQQLLAMEYACLVIATGELRVRSLGVLGRFERRDLVPEMLRIGRERGEQAPYPSHGLRVETLLDAALRGVGLVAERRDPRAVRARRETAAAAAARGNADEHEHRSEPAHGGGVTRGQEIKRPALPGRRAQTHC